MSSHAAVVGVDTGIHEGSGSVSASTLGDFGFGWDVTSGVYGAYVDFEADAAFDISVLSYNPDATGVSDFEISGVVLERRDSLGGTILSTLTTDVAACGQPLFSTSYASCNYVSYTGYAGIGSDTATLPGEVFLEGLDAGFYRLSFFESGTPASGSAGFQVSDTTVVPLPAALPMLLIGLGGLSLVARRRRASNS